MLGSLGGGRCSLGPDDALFCVVVCGVPLRCPVDVLGSPPCPIDDSSGGLLSIVLGATQRDNATTSAHA